MNFIASYLITLLGNQILKGKIVLQESVARNWENKIITKNRNQLTNQPTNKENEELAETKFLTPKKDKMLFLHLPFQFC